MAARAEAHRRGWGDEQVETVFAARLLAVVGHRSTDAHSVIYIATHCMFTLGQADYFTVRAVITPHGWCKCGWSCTVDTFS